MRKKRANSLQSVCLCRNGLRRRTVNWGLRATVIGANSDRTFGKAVIQNVARLSDGSGVVVTTARYETPKRTDINQKGIGADRTVKCEKKEPAESCLAQAL